MATSNQVSVLAADDDETKASAARLAAQADTTTDFGATVRELLGEVAKGEHLVVLRPDQEVTPAGAADLLGVSRQFVDRLLAEGLLPFRRLPDSRHRRIKVGDVVTLAEERERRRKGAAAVRSALGGRLA
jgi:excisionase family DNA binding protein